MCVGGIPVGSGCSGRNPCLAELGFHDLAFLSFGKPRSLTRKET